jgi:hypothetical protein
VNKQQQKDPTHEITQLIQLKHWIPLHHQKPNKSIKDFPPTTYIMNSHQKQASSEARTYFLWLYTTRVKVIILNKICHKKQKVCCKSLKVF